MAPQPFHIPDERIIRGTIFRTAFPFIEERPLSFFEGCEKCTECEMHGTGHDYCGKITSKPYGFEGDNDDVLFVLTRFKARHAIVLSTPVLNVKSRWSTIIVAPIVGIHDDELEKLRIQKIMKRDESYFTAYYLEPSITGMHCYIDLSKMGPIHKSWLLQEKAVLNTEADFASISERIGVMLAQRRLVDCRNCKRPCEDCVIKDELAAIKEQLQKQQGA